MVVEGLDIVHGRYIGLRINYWLDPNNRNANEPSMSQSSNVEIKREICCIKHSKAFLTTMSAVSGNHPHWSEHKG